MPTTVEVIEREDGRRLEFLLGGDPDGFPLVMHHGTPSDATLFADWDTDCAKAGMRLVLPGRPGYGGSIRAPGRSVADAAGDVDAVLRHLGCTEFVTAGWSGGGPHALACAARLPERCLGAATLAGVGPFNAPDLDFLDGMGPENLDEFGAAFRGEAALREWMDANAPGFRHVTADQLSAAFAGLVPQVDRDVLTGGFAEHLASVMRRALAPGFDGWIDDDLAFIRYWGFEIGSATVPVTVWQGDLDLMVPFAHGQWLARHLPNAVARMASGHGHLSLVTDFRGEILNDLKKRAGNRIARATAP